MSHRKSLITLLAVALSTTLGSCRAVDEPTSSFFGEDCVGSDGVETVGCIDIEGYVTGSRGQPLNRIDVTPTLSAAPELTTDLVLTGPDGHYQLRLLSKSSGTVTFLLKATMRTDAGVETASQTLTITAPVTPLDERPDPVVVNFTLPVS